MIPPTQVAVVVASHGRDEESVLASALRAGVPYVVIVASPKRSDGRTGHRRPRCGSDGGDRPRARHDRAVSTESLSPRELSKDWYFCCTGCRQAFADDPARCRPGEG